MPAADSFGNSFDFYPNVSVFGSAFSFAYYFGATHPQGREPIGLNQPTSNGTDYPFVRPSEDIKHLIGDLFVSFDSIDRDFVMPLRVVWLYGFGSAASPQPGGVPTPEHSQDMLILDADDKVVADTTQAESFTSHTWNSRLQVLEWIVSEVCVVRCVRYTAWSLEDVLRGRVVFFPQHIVPVDGTLADEACYRIPKRVRSVSVGLARYTSTSLSVQEGYNVTLVKEEATDANLINAAQFGLQTSLPRVAGQRVAHRVQISAVAGTGLGVQPGCDEDTGGIKTINKIKPDSSRNFRFDASGCIRLQRPVVVTNLSPRQATYASPGYTSTEAASMLSLQDECLACCKCEDFARVYQGLKRESFQHRAVAATVENTRDIYRDSISRWEQARDQRESQSLRLRLQADGECKISWGFVHCNASKCCLLRVTAVLTWLYYVNGVLTTPLKAGFDCRKTMIEGSGQCGSPEKTLLAVPGTSNDRRVYSLSWDYANPQTTTAVQGRVCFPECRQVVPQSLRVRLHVVIFWEDALPDADSLESCGYPVLAEADIPLDVRTTWQANGFGFPSEPLRTQRLSPLLTVSSDNRLCESCNCE